MGIEMQITRYVVHEKTFIVRDLDMERVAQKKVEKRASKLPPEKREIFLRISEALGAAVIWERLNSHVFEALSSANPMTKAGNIYQLHEDINRVLNRIEKWVRRNSTFSEEKVKEFAANIHRSSKSICRLFDQNATCWKKRSEAVVLEHV